MSLQLITGAAGSGKSHAIYEYLIAQSEGEGHCILLVPEQFTLEAQKELTLMHPRGGMCNVEVLSFKRLAWTVFEELGMEDQIVLDDMGKSVILSKVAKEQEASLQYFRKNIRKPGFINKLKSALSELEQYGVGREQLEQVCGQVGGHALLQYKIRELSQLYQAFREKLTDGTITAEELLSILAAKVGQSEIIARSVLVLDGFHGFTPVQYRLIGELLRCAPRVIVSVTLPPGCDPFAPGCDSTIDGVSGQMVRRLTDLAREQGAGRLADIRIGGEKGRFSSNPPLAFLERHVMRFDGVRWQGPQQALSLHVCRTPMDEVGYVCRRVGELVRDGYRYREIAVITGDLEGYESIIRQEMTRKRIPCFIDRKKSFMNHPLAEYLRSGLEVIRGNFTAASVFRHLKSGLCSVPEEDRDYLENYVLAMGIRGFNRWQQEWNLSWQDSGTIDFLRLNRIRETALCHLFTLRERLHHAPVTVKEYVDALEQMLEEEGIEEKLLHAAEKFQEQGEPALASEYRQAWGLLAQLLREIEELLRDDEMSLPDFIRILDSGLEEIRVGLIPACADRLVVGDMERTRLSGIRALFFIGVNEGLVPRQDSGGGILTDYDREILERFQIELAPTTRKNSFIQRFYLYLALTRPSDKLYLSWAKTDSTGRSLRPSSFFSELTGLFPDLETVDEERLEDPLGQIAWPTDFIPMFAGELRDCADGREECRSDLLRELYRQCREQDPEATDGLLRAAASHYQEETLSEQVSRMLYGEVLSGSVSRLELQARCPCAQFLSYGLELRERAEYAFTPADMGNIFHKTLERVFLAVQSQGRALYELEEEERKLLVRECITAVTGGYGNEILTDNARNKWLGGRLERITCQTVWALGEQLRENGYRPEGVELSFHADNSSAFLMELGDGRKMRLSGRIDRMDLKEDADRLYLRIVDYKSGSKSFDLAEVYYGLQLQLIFYLEAALEDMRRRRADKPVVPAGAFYYNIKTPFVEGSEGQSAEERQEKLLEQMQMNGLSNRASGDQCSGGMREASPEQFELLQRYVYREVRRLGEAILTGRIQVDPCKSGGHDSCQWCPYGSVCGFDKKQPGYRHRNLSAMKPEEVWKALEESEEETESETARELERRRGDE